MNLLIKLMFLVTISLSIFSMNVERAGTKATNPTEDFLLDPSKPYVYLEADHVGPRKPLSDREPSKGIWLRLKNNCRLPVVIVASQGTVNASSEFSWVGDEVVPNQPPPGTESEGAGMGYQPGQENLTDIFHWPNVNEAEVRGAENRLKRISQGVDKDNDATRPHGYNDGYQPGPQVLRVVPPGEGAIFSVPMNHVGKDWHFEIPFRLALSNKARRRPPYSYVAFYQEDLDALGSAAQPIPTTH